MAESDLNLSRRTVVTGVVAAAAGTALVVPVVLSTVPNSNVTVAGTAGPAPATALGAYLRIDSADTVTLLIGSTEMGQGIMTGLAQLVAEELQLSWTQIKVEHGLASAAWPNPFGNPIFGAQLTGGSTSMRGWYMPLRKAAATAGQMLIEAAKVVGGAGTWALVPGGKVSNGTKTLLFSDLVGTAAGLTPPTTVTLATTTSVIGKRMARVDVPAKVDGSAVFGMDVRVPGMVYASVVHCPTLGGVVKTMPTTPSGAIALVNLGNAVGVVATDTWSAMTLANSLTSKITWTLPTNLASRDSTSLQATASRLVADPQAVLNSVKSSGTDPVAALAAAKSKIDVTYNLPFLAHACMEVLNCTASVTATSCEVWAPTQGQQFCIPTIKAITGLDASAITVHTTFLGGGLGRKIEQDYIGQAVKIAKAVGKPVKLIWSRKQDFQNDMYRPCATIRVQAGLDANKALSGLIYRNVSPSINIQRNTKPGNNPEDTGAIAGAADLPFAIGGQRIEYVPLITDIPLGYWRSVGESYNTFAVESALDELALSGGLDPMELRRSLLVAGGDSRAVAVLDAVKTLSGWTTTATTGTARGVAFLKGFGSYIAVVAQVSQTTVTTASRTTLTIPKVTKLFCAIDCGLAINPDQIESQMEGGLLHGLSAAMWGQVTFANGVPSVSNFSNYRVAKAGDTPAIAVTIVGGTGPTAAAPGGVGETGVPCVAPAIANAFAKLTKTRLRTLPFYPGASMGD